MRQLLKGAPAKQLDEAIEAGWKGAQKGLHKAMRKAVLEGVEEGLKRSRRWRDSGDFDQEIAPPGVLEKTENRLSLEQRGNEPLTVDAPDAAGKRLEDISRGQMPKYERIIQSGGHTVRQTLELRGNRLEVVNEVDIGDVGEAAPELRLIQEKRAAVDSKGLNCAPWSELKIWGVPIENAFQSRTVRFNSTLASMHITLRQTFALRISFSPPVTSISWG